MPSGPLAEITHTARRIAESGDLSLRVAVPVGRHGGVAQLAAAFNAMLERLDHDVAAERRFAADAGHELRAPLTAILGHANLIRRRGLGHPELVTESVAAIIEEAERLQRITRKLLDLARLDERGDLARDVVSLGQVAAGVVAELMPLAREKEIELTVTRPAASTRIRGDRDQLEHLAMNLVENALKFTPGGGQVHVATWPDRAGPTPTVVLEVRDSGRGIAAADMPHIFERFYRARGVADQEAEGAGLGLSIVREVALRHGGVVEAESQPGQGALFRVRLPALIEGA